MRTIVGAIGAGIVAGCLILLCFAGFNGPILHTPGFTLAGIFAFDAAALVGKAALAGGAGYVALGIVLHFLVSIGWAVGYALLAPRQHQLITRPIASGAGFGLVVYFAMQLVLVGANLYRTPTPGELGIALLAHLVFFGMPIAFLIGRAAAPSLAANAG